MKILKLITCLFLLFNLIGLNAQINPASDPNWTRVKQDLFNGPSLNNTNWDTLYPWSPSGVPVSNGDEYNSASNILFNHTSGYMSIKCEPLATPIYWPRPNYASDSVHYKSAVIWSKFKYKYGYWEISAKLPAGHRGYWPAFWLWGSGSNVCTVPPKFDVGWINEIDIVENGGLDSQYTNKMGMNYHWTDSITCGGGSLSGGLLPTPTDSVPNNITYPNKYGMLWEPGKMTWYFNDIPVKTITDPIYTPNHAISTIINFAIPPKGDYVPDPFLTVFPAYFEVDYLNIYQLTPSSANCSIVENICTFNASTYTYQVKKSISIGGSGCTSNINTTNNVGLWATDFVLLNEGTTITSGGSGSFSANTTNCPN